MSTESSKTRKIFDGRYEIVSIVGRGAASVVYHGRRATAPYADVAIKVLTDKGATIPAKERLRKEALAMLYARHRYVVRLDDFRSVGDLCYLSMEFAPHRDLRHYVTERGSECTASQRERYFSQAAEALGYVHRAGLIHRDIKPDNILVMNEVEIRIADFGVAVLPSDEASLTELQRGVGTMEYLAPEVLDGVRCDQRSDVYSLGVTFYELLAGQHPFSQSPLAEQLSVRKDGAFAELIQVAPHVPDYINTAIMRCLAFDPVARFDNGQQLFESLLLGRDKSKRKAKGRSRTQQLGKSDSDINASTLDPLNDADQELSEASNTSSSIKPTALPTQLTVGELQEGDEELLAERDHTRETVLIPREEVAAVRTSERASSPTLASPTEQMAGVRSETSTSLKSFKSFADIAHKSPTSPSKVSSSRSSAEDSFGGTPFSGEHENSKLALIADEIRARIDHAITYLVVMAQELQSDDRVKKYLPLAAVMIAFLIGLAIFSGHSSTPAIPNKTDSNGVASIIAPRIDSQAVALSFPKLEPGRYEGRIEGLIPGVTSPIAFIVPANATSVITLVGIEGWSPVIGRYPSGTGADKLRVSSNGFLIDFTGQVDGDSIIGFFHDLSTGAQGRWEARAAR